MTSRNWVLLATAAALLWPSAASAGPEEKAVAQSIAQQVKESGQLSNYRLGVSYLNGVATLSGEVSDAAQARIATKLASQVSGVTKVVNKLKVKSATPSPVQATEEKSGGLLVSLANAMQSPKKSPMPAPQQPQLRPTNNRMPMAMGPSQMPGVNPAHFQQAGLQQAQCSGCNGGAGGGYAGGYAGGGYSGGGGAAAVGYENANMPGYAWPSYAAYPNYSALTYPKQYSPTAWPYIGPFYPYPQVPLGWRKVSLEWDDGWWFLDFSHHQCQ